MSSIWAKKITTIFPLYLAADKVEALVASVAGQKHSDFAKQSDWMEILFIDNASTDSTVETLRTAIEKHYPSASDRAHIQVEVNPTNLGLSRSLNKALGMTKTPFGLTCHSDCRFSRDDYVAEMLRLLESHPKAGAITGQTSIDRGKPLPLTEKVNLITNLMDLFPPASDTELVPIGFAEGRCDGFRLDALRAAGFYDTTLKLAGEDQILAARMREHGYEIYQAPHLPYLLSVSVQQDTIGKLARHQQRYGRAHPYIVLLGRGTHHGTLTRSAGANRRARTLLRLWQLTSATLYVAAFLLLIFGGSWQLALTLLLIVFGIKFVIFGRHLQQVRLSPKELAIFLLFQPVFDFSYSFGVAQGLWLLRKSSQGREIG